MTEPRGRAPRSLRWAAWCLVLLGLEKAAAAAYGLRIALTQAAGPGLPAGVQSAVAARPVLFGTAAVLWYGANAAFALVVARALLRGRPWARPAAIVFGGFHAFGIVGFMLFGPVVLLNGLLGVLIAVLALRASPTSAQD